MFFCNGYYTYWIVVPKGVPRRRFPSIPRTRSAQTDPETSRTPRNRRPDTATISAATWPNRFPIDWLSPTLLLLLPPPLPPLTPWGSGHWNPACSCIPNNSCSSRNRPLFHTTRTTVCWSPTAAAVLKKPIPTMAINRNQKKPTATTVNRNRPRPTV